MLDNLLFQLRFLLVAVSLAAGFVDTNTAFYVKSTNNFGCSQALQIILRFEKTNQWPLAIEYHGEKCTNISI